MNGAGSLLRYFRRLVDYNVWANTRISELCLSLDSSLFDHKFEGSFPSIRSTVSHLWDAEFIWLTRLHGTSPTEFPSQSRSIRQPQICDGMVQTSSDFKRHVYQLTDAQVIAGVEYQTTRGHTYTNTVDQIVSHTMNHSTYHRGQIIQYARQLGAEQVASTDQMLFFRLNPLDIS